MKTPVALLFCLTLALASFAQEPAAAPPELANSQFTSDQLEQLLGPIALYPDALIALMLPAATAPADMVLAARYLKDGGDPAAVASRAWDESVKSLVHYADVVKWMDDNLAWTKQLGEIFRAQPAEVMQAIQRLRTKARAAGTLKDSPQQQVIVDDEVISIVPALANMLYVPYYDSAIVYAPPPPAFYDSAPWVTFSPAFPVGPWLVFDCDWRHRAVWKDDHDNNRAHPDRHDWRHPVFPGQPGYVNDPGRHPWRPPTNLPPKPIVNIDRRDVIARPAPLSGAARPALTHNDTPKPRDNSPERPPRTDGRNAGSNFNRPIATLPASTVTTAIPPPVRHADPGSGSGRNDSGDRPNRTIAFPNPPNARPGTNNNPVPVAQASQPPSNLSFNPPPASRIVPAFTGPIVAPLPPPPSVTPAPAAAPAPAPAAPPAAPPASDKGSSRDGDQKKQAY